MKTNHVKLAVVALALFSSCSNTGSKLQISADIEDLRQGDTIFFTRYSLESRQSLSTDTLIVAENEKFTYQAQLYNTQYYLAHHAPVQGEPLPTCKRGIAIFAHPGDKLYIKGDIEHFNTIHPKGGMYDDPRLQRLFYLEDSTYTARNILYRKAIYFRKMLNTPEANPDSAQYYVEAFNTYRTTELRQEEKRIAESIDDSEYAAMIYLERLSDISYPDFKERFEHFSPEIQASTTGKILEQMLRVKANIEPGNTPTTFTVTAIDSSRVSLSDYRGKYLLIYNWGLCPGTIWVHPRLLELYNTYHDKGFEVLGFTDGPLPDKFRNEDTAPLFDQPWTTVYTTTPGNEFIKDEYYFAGVPILMVISPEGKTLYRGYSDIYEPLKELLKQKLDAD